MLAILALGSYNSRRALENHAWTGAALAEGVAALLAVPGGVVGSAVGVAFGRWAKKAAAEEAARRLPESEVND